VLAGTKGEISQSLHELRTKELIKHRMTYAEQTAAEQTSGTRMEAAIEAEELIERKNLKSRDRAWTEAAIKRFLPESVVERRHSAWHGDYSVRIFKLRDVIHAENSEAFATHNTKYLRRQQKRNAPVKVSLIDAIREASRSAHRWRDRAAARWASGTGRAAGSASREKRRWYALKDRGIAAAYEQGLLRYAGAAPQGMAVYEYGGGGMSCFHSTLHPVGRERPLVEGHPEVLTVPAKEQQLRLKDAEHTLSCLPEINSQAYQRSSAPEMKMERGQGAGCWECGDFGHLARECARGRLRE
jgi:hypothetical protein